MTRCLSALPADEIMHQDITPLCAADIQDQLKKRFAYLSGERRAGRQEGGSVPGGRDLSVSCDDVGLVRVVEPGTRPTAWPALDFIEGQERLCDACGGGRRLGAIEEPVGGHLGS